MTHFFNLHKTVYATSPSGHNRITGAIFATLLKQPNTYTPSPPVFKKLDCRQQKTVVLERWEPKAVSHMTAQFTALRGFPDCGSRRELRQPGRFLLKEMELRVRETRQLELLDRVPQRRDCMDKSPEVCRGPFKGSVEY